MCAPILPCRPFYPCDASGSRFVTMAPLNRSLASCLVTPRIFALMNSSLARVRRGAVFLALVLAVSICGYRWFGRTWLDATYMVVITVATIGYGEHSELPPGEQFFTILVVLFGLTASAYTLGGLLQSL